MSATSLDVTQLRLMMMRSVPPNLQFEVDDLEKEWNFSQKFDYIHSQLMIGAFQDVCAHLAFS